MNSFWYAESMPTALDRSRRLVLPELIGRGRARASRSRRARLRRATSARTPPCTSARARLATVLADRACARGDRVALLLHNGLEFPESLLACHLLGAVAVPINFRLAADEIAYILRDSGAVALIADHVPEGVGGPVRIDVGGVLRTARRERRPRAPSRPGWPRTTPRSSVTRPGTTGRPKGAVLTHGNLVASTLSWIHEMRAGADDVWLSGHAAVPHRRHQRRCCRSSRSAPPAS